MFASSADGSPAQAKPMGSRLVGSKLTAFFGRVVSSMSVQRRERRLRLCEMLSLGEKRFVAVVEYGPQKFLLAGTPQNISLLRHLDANLDGANESPRTGSDSE